MVRVIVDKIAVVTERLKTARDRQKIWTDLKRRPFEFHIGEKYI